MAAEEHWEFQVTIPAGTLITAPLVVATKIPFRRVTAIRWTVPPGPSGLAGWRVLMSGVQLVPNQPGTWIVRDNHTHAAEYDNLPETDAWSVAGYNTGTFAHTLYVTYYAQVVRQAPRLSVPLGLDELQPGLYDPPAGAGYAGQP